jgi:ABC-type nitrate/sulfonate/bicarbonate transport system permease component
MFPQLFYRWIETTRRLALISVVLLVGYQIWESIDVLGKEWDTLNLALVQEEIPTFNELEAAWDEHEQTLREDHIPATLEVTVWGLALAIGIGLSLAALMDLIAPLRWLLYPLLVLSQTIPIFAIAVILILLFGFGTGPKIVVVALFCFYPITISTLGGLRSVDSQYTALLRSMGANRLQIWWKVRLPSAMPAFFSGLKLSATYCVIGAVMGEYVGSGDGLGKFLQRSYRSFASDQVFLAVGIIAALSVGFLSLVFLIERVALRWRYVGRVSYHYTVADYIQIILGSFKKSSTTTSNTASLQVSQGGTNVKI